MLPGHTKSELTANYQQDWCSASSNHSAWTAESFYLPRGGHLIAPSSLCSVGIAALNAPNCFLLSSLLYRGTSCAVPWSRVSVSYKAKYLGEFWVSMHLHCIAAAAFWLLGSAP